MADPDIQTLRFFLSIYDQKNLTRAAALHNIAPSALTKRLRDLEMLYGVELFRRQSRGVVATPAGMELARHARDLFSRFAHTKATMSEFSKGARGQVRVHATASILLEALIKLVVSFTAAHPLIRIELHELMSWTIVRDIAEGRADVGFVAGSVEIPPDLANLAFREDHLMVLLPPDHVLSGRDRIAFEELFEFEHVGIGATSALSIQLAEEASRINRAIPYSYRAATYDVARMMVAEGCGIAILPRSLVLPYVHASLDCIPLSDSWAKREMRICYREEAALTVAARLFIRHSCDDANEANLSFPIRD